MAENVQFTFEIKGLDKLNKAEVDVKALTKEVNNTLKAQDILNNTQKKNAKQTAALSEEYKRNRKALESARQDKKKYNDALKREIELSKTVKGSIGEVNAQLKIEKARMKDVVIGSKDFKIIGTRIKDLENKQRAFNGQLGRGTTFVGEYGKGFKQGFAQVGIAIAGALAAFRGLNRLIAGSLEAYSKQESAERSLATALGGTSKAILNQASAIQAKTKFGDEELIQGAAFLAQMGSTEKEIQKLLPTIADFAAAKGIDLKTAADLVSKSVNSETNALSRYGIVIEGAVGSDERLESALNSLNGAFEGQAEAVATVDGGLTQLGNTIGDSQEQFGRLISVILDKFIPGINEGLSKVNALNEVMLDSIEAGDDLAESASRVFEAFAGDTVDKLANSLRDGIITQEEFTLKSIEIARERGVLESEALVTAVKRRIVEINDLEDAENEKNKQKLIDSLAEAAEKQNAELTKQVKKQQKIRDAAAKKAQDEAEKRDARIAQKNFEVADAEVIREIEADIAEQERVRLQGERIAEIELEILNAKIDAEIQADIKEEERLKRKAEERKQFAIGAAQEVANATIQIISQRADKSNQIEQQKLKEKFDAGLLSENEYRVAQNEAEKKAFRQGQARDISQALINGALAITKILAQTGVVSPVPIALAGITTAAQIAVIGNQKFAKGGVLEGNSHAQGGIKTPFGEMEGGEAVINKNSTRLFRDQLSAINQAGGGVKFALGGVTPTPNITSNQNLDVSKILRDIRVVNVATETTGLATEVINEETADNF